MESDIIKEYKRYFENVVYLELEKTDIIYVKSNNPIKNLYGINTICITLSNIDISSDMDMMYKSIIHEIGNAAISFAYTIIQQAKQDNKCILFYSFSEKMYTRIDQSLISYTTISRLIIEPNFIFVDKNHYTISPPRIININSFNYTNIK